MTPDTVRYAPDAAAGRSLWWYGTVLLRHRRLIAMTSVGAALIVGFATLLRDRQYAATMLLRPTQSTAAPAGLGALTAQLGLGALAGGDSPEFYSRLVHSRDLLWELAQREFDVQDPAFKGTLVEHLEIEPSRGETRNGPRPCSLTSCTAMT
jgi:uncharacterized protein involved in exopolysaccharide biosynthesis